MSKIKKFSPLTAAYRTLRLALLEGSLSVCQLSAIFPPSLSVMGPVTNLEGSECYHHLPKGQSRTDNMTDE
jgi:hypothetical protein